MRRSRWLLLSHIWVSIGYWAAPMQAQSIDSLTRLLTSARVSDRWNAVTQLDGKPLDSVPPATRTVAIELLDREATGAQPIDRLIREGDEYGEYLVALTSFVARLGDARALRGEVLEGIETSLAIQEFVARFGSRALPYLDDAWIKRRAKRPSIVETLGVMLRPGLVPLGDMQPVAVRRRLLAPDDTFAINLARAAVQGRIAAFAPLIDSLARDPRQGPGRPLLANSANELWPLYDAEPLPARIAELGDWVGAICSFGIPAQQTYCAAAPGLIVTASARAAKQPAAARTAMLALIQATQSARRARGIGTMAGALVVADAERIANALRP